VRNAIGISVSDLVVIITLSTVPRKMDCLTADFLSPERKNEIVLSLL
jgi:hypothetical protein